MRELPLQVYTQNVWLMQCPPAPEGTEFPCIEGGGVRTSQQQRGSGVEQKGPRCGTKGAPVCKGAPVWSPEPHGSEGMTSPCSVDHRIKCKYQRVPCKGYLAYKKQPPP